MKGEMIRMFEISQSFDGLPCIFIRYNPDAFYRNGKIVKMSPSSRHTILVKWIKKCLREKPSGFVAKYLFYDDFDESDVSFTPITEQDVI
jgi:hypothetical protein